MIQVQKHLELCWSEKYPDWCWLFRWRSQWLVPKKL